MSDCWMNDSHKDDHRSGDLLTVGDRHIPAATCCRNHGWNNRTTVGVLQVGVLQTTAGVLQVSDHY
jgi:hypothetical protein